MAEKNMFLSSALTPEQRKEAVIREYPDYADWPFWDDDGLPSPDPKELATFVPGGFDFDEDESEV